MPAPGRNRLLWGNTFTPRSIPGLALWLDASRLALADGDPVTTWPDLSGNGRDATQATAGKKPTFKTAIQNGKGVVRGDGVDDVLSVTLATSSAWTFFFVGKRVTYPASNARFFAFATATTINIYDAATTQFGFYSTEAGGVTALGGNTTVFSQVTLELTSDAAGTAYVNGAVGATFDPKAFSAGTLLTLFAASATPDNPHNADIGEFIGYNTVHSAANRQRIEAYLKSKWGTP